ncbi:MAG TPA: hypothetical protein VNL16_10095 [Chloroflexota bacterium]|nr:hypothetical protein [Chloroflexota bacterium]
MRETTPHPAAHWIDVAADEERYQVRQAERLIGASECWLKTTGLVRGEIRRALMMSRTKLFRLHAGAAVQRR